MLGILVGAYMASRMIDTVQSAVDKNHAVAQAVADRDTRVAYDRQGLLVVDEDADIFYGKKYQEVYYALKGMGFRNFRLHEVRQPRTFFNSDIEGNIASVSINGKSDFKDGDAFPQTACVLLSVRMYYDSPELKLPDVNVKRRSRRQTESPEDDFPEELYATFCEYCGNPFKFGHLHCTNCGSPRRKISQILNY